MNENVEVWQQGQLQTSGILIFITANCEAVVQDSDGWLTCWPVESVRVLPTVPAPSPAPTPTPAP